MKERSIRSVLSIVSIAVFTLVAGCADINPNHTPTGGNQFANAVKVTQPDGYTIPDRALF
ncbi:hypothetical protein [Kozakia baliensis]|uniref:hypothetical protein n=1 Tax=Kozakia baliensis TaxID=153496 RepID=UPI0012451AA2|nr:hypothetical protein [Kozakia baliensis]